MNDYYNSPCRRERLETPWGTADSVRYVNADKSVVKVSTSSHGGIGVDHTKLQLPDHLTIPAIKTDTMLWFEEDSDWCCVALALPVLFPDEQDAAEATLRNSLPQVYKTHYGRMPTAEESLKVREMELNRALHSNFRVRTGFGDWAWNVPVGHVYVVGVRASDNATAGFLVPEAEYKNYDAMVLDAYPRWEPDMTLPRSKPAGWRSALAPTKRSWRHGNAKGRSAGSPACGHLPCV